MQIAPDPDEKDKPPRLNFGSGAFGPGALEFVLASNANQKSATDPTATLDSNQDRPRSELESAIAARQFIKIGEADLLPSVASDPVVMKYGEKLDIYVDLRDKSKDPYTFVHVPEQDGNEPPYILVNEAMHKWDPPYVRDHVMFSDSSFGNSNQLQTPEKFLVQLKRNFEVNPALAKMEENLQKITSSVYSMAEELLPGEGKKLNILVTSEDFRSQAGAFESREGSHYIVLKADVLTDTLQSDDMTAGFIAVIGHELAHLRNGDQTALGLARVHNASDPMVARRYQEKRADIVGAGPLGANNPEALANFLQKYLLEIPNKSSLREDLVHEYNRAHDPKDTISHLIFLTKNETERILNWNAGLSDKGHPPPDERIVSLRKEAELMREYEKDHPDANKTLDGRVVENDYILNRMGLCEDVQPSLSATPEPKSQCLRIR